MTLQARKARHLKMLSLPHSVIQGAAQRGVIAFLKLKQSNRPAYWGHVLVARVLDARGCPREAVRIQLVKAAQHAQDPSEIADVAQSLRAKTQSPSDYEDLVRRVGDLSELEDWNHGLRDVYELLKRSDAVHT